MKKWLLAAAFVVVSASSLTYVQKSHAMSNGFVGNVCRNGIYYQVLPAFYAVGSNCYLASFNLFGIITAE